jgi:hypothetical protein
MTFINTTVELDGYWGKKSAFIKRGTVLYKLKKRYQSLLLVVLKQLLNDRPNQVSHIALTDDAHPQDPEPYAEVDGTQLTLTYDSIQIFDDWVQIAIPCKNPERVKNVVDGNIHMTLYFQKGVGKSDEQKAILKQSFSKVIDSLVEKPDLPCDIILSQYEAGGTKKPKVRREKIQRSSDSQTNLLMSIDQKLSTIVSVLSGQQKI